MAEKVILALGHSSLADLTQLPWLVITQRLRARAAAGDNWGKESSLYEVMTTGSGEHLVELAVNGMLSSYATKS
jgi:hypothetical protein